MELKGIKLTLGTDGEVQAVDSEDGELCAGIIICPHCSANICDIDGKSWADIRRCPLKKWNTYTYYDSPAIALKTAENTCYMCGGMDFWKNGGGPLVCANCHPPMELTNNINKIELLSNPLQLKSNKKKKEKPKPKEQENQQKIFS